MADTKDKPSLRDRFLATGNMEKRTFMEKVQSWFELAKSEFYDVTITSKSSYICGLT